MAVDLLNIVTGDTQPYPFKVAENILKISSKMKEGSFSLPDSSLYAFEHGILTKKKKKKRVESGSSSKESS